MKVVSKDGKTWFQKNEDGSTVVGFTKSFLENLDCCWHMMAAVNRMEIKEDQPLLSVETNDGLFSVAAPCAGVISYFDNKALNFPDKLDDETVVAVMKPVKEEAIEEEVPVRNDNPFAVPARPVAQARLDLEQIRAQFAQPIDWDAIANQPIPVAPARPLRFR